MFLILFFRGAKTGSLGGEMTTCFVGWTPDGAAWARVLAGDIVLCSWARHVSLTVPPSTQAYK